MVTRGGRLTPLSLTSRKEHNMKVRISKREDGVSDVVVVPSRRSGLMPVMVRKVTQGNLRSVVKKLISDASGKPAPVIED